MSFNDWISSSISRQPLSTTTNINNMKQQHYHYHYHYHHHYHYPSTETTNSPSSYQNQDTSNSFAIVPSMPIIDHQYKENLYRNPTFKLHRCINLFLQLIGRNNS